MVQIFKDFLDDESISQEVVIRDLQKVIEYENPRITKREQIETEAIQGHPMTFYRYHRYADMLKYLDFIQRKFSKYVELIHIGRSYEGRPLIVVKITFQNPAEPELEPRVKNYRKGGKRKKKRSEKPAVFIEAGAHAREWISPASGLWIVDRLLRVIDDNDTAQIEALKAVDWYVMPVLNPDGYEFSHEFDRMWQKTRSMYSDKPSGILSTA
jgi:murein tripeptide amidase MpaA